MYVIAVRSEEKWSKRRKRRRARTKPMTPKAPSQIGDVAITSMFPQVVVFLSFENASNPVPRKEKRRYEMHCCVEWKGKAASDVLLLSLLVGLETISTKPKSSASSISDESS
jgi:hypothetical protein